LKELILWCIFSPDLSLQVYIQASEVPGQPLYFTGSGTCIPCSLAWSPFWLLHVLLTWVCCDETWERCEYRCAVFQVLCGIIDGD